MKKSLEYTDLAEHFGEHRLVDLAVARYYVYGDIPPHTPKEWDWNEIVAKFHVPAKTKLFLLAKSLPEKI